MMPRILFLRAASFHPGCSVAAGWRLPPSRSRSPRLPRLRRSLVLTLAISCTRARPRLPLRSRTRAPAATRRSPNRPSRRRICACAAVNTLPRLCPPRTGPRLRSRLPQGVRLDAGPVRQGDVGHVLRLLLPQRPPPPAATSRHGLRARRPCCGLQGARAHTHTCHHPGTPQREKAHRDPPATLSARYRYRGRRRPGVGRPVCRPSRASLSRVHDTPGTRPQTDRRSRGWNAAPRALTVLVLLTPSATRRVATYAPSRPAVQTRARPKTESTLAPGVGGPVILL